MKEKRIDLETVTETIVQRIISYEIRPGSMLVDKEIAEEFSISRWNVREVIFRIAQQGLVNIIQKKGVFVVNVSFKTVIENLQIRECLEGLAARLAAQNSGIKDWEKFVTYFDDSAFELISKGQHKIYINNVLKFHNQIIKKADNYELSSIMNLIYNKTLMIIKRTVILPDRAKHSIIEHRNVLQALIEKNADQAESFNREHLKKILDWVVQYKDFII